MANIKSQIKRIGTNKKAQERNKAVRSEVKTAVRVTREAIAAGDAAKAQAALAVASKKLDKATSKGVIHANNAANRKSAIAKAVAGLGAAKPAKPAKAEKAPAKAAAAK
jgi:small subunit ribosomal protein S20